MTDRVSRLRLKVGALLDALEEADRDLFIEATDLLLLCWDQTRASDESHLEHAEVCVDLAMQVLHDSPLAVGHLREALAHLRRPHPPS